MESAQFKLDSMKRNEIKSQIENGNLSKERRETINRISIFAKENGNELGFIDFGDEELEKSASETNLRDGVALGLNERDTKILNEGISVLKMYLSGNIFTDQYLEHKNFSNIEDINTRVGWEKAYIYNGYLKEEEIEYYKSNRLNNGSRIHPTLGYLDLIVEIIKDPVIKRELEILYEQIPNELRENIIFDKLSNEEKVEKVFVFSEILKKVIKILDKSENLTENK